MADQKLEQVAGLKSDLPAEQLPEGWGIGPIQPPPPTCPPHCKNFTLEQRTLYDKTMKYLMTSIFTGTLDRGVLWNGLDLDNSVGRAVAFVHFPSLEAFAEAVKDLSTITAASIKAFTGAASIGFQCFPYTSETKPHLTRALKAMRQNPELPNDEDAFVKTATDGFAVLDQCKVGVLWNIGVVHAYKDDTPEDSVYYTYVCQFINDTQACQVCDVVPVKVLCCSKCKSGRYCSAACQRRDWRAHKPKCA
jgi:hypothetical protein